MPDLPLSFFPLDFAYAYGEPPIEGWLKQLPEHFRVEELLGFELAGEGEHLYLQIEKRGLNSADLAGRLAKLFGVRPMDVGYAGMKDKHAVTTQWYSVYLPKTEGVASAEIELENAKVLEVTRHRHKLRRGQHQGNRFSILLTQVEGDTEVLGERLERIAANGVPNYFGPQRFGIEGNNLAVVERWFVDKKPPRGRSKGIYLSAARSYLFNRLLSQRVADGSWCNLEAGDLCSEAAPGLPTGPLWGRGRVKTGGRIAVLENSLAQEYAEWCEGLEHSGLQQERRPLCLPLQDLHWTLEREQLRLEFVLPVGCYATSVVREICCYRDMSRLPKQSEG